MPPPKNASSPIDDDASVCGIHESALSLLGFDVSCAVNAKEGQGVPGGPAADLILMDIMMPDQDGISLTRELRNDAKTSDIPILVVSGLADAGTLNDALLFGAVDYLVKPIDLDTLKGKIDRTFAHIEKRRKGAAPK